MDILRKYRHFVNEAVDSDKNLKSITDVPAEVIKSAKKIATDMFDKVSKPHFEWDDEDGIVMMFSVTEQDFRYIDENENLTLDITDAAKSKRSYDVTLVYLDRISETFEVQYNVMFELNDYPGEIIDDDEDVIIDDDYEKIDPDDTFFDGDEVHLNILKAKYKIKDDIDLVGDDDDDF